jgi:hypothetical protein
MSEERQQASGASDLKAIACNYSEATATCSKGALCYVSRLWKTPGRARVRILARSRSGRWIQKWEDIRRLENFRLKTLPTEHPRY